MSEAPVENALEAFKLQYSFGSKPALKGLSFSVKAGSIHAFVGPNGAGKTTTLKIAASILPLQAGGTLKVFGRDLRGDYAAVRRLISFMPDYFSMYKHMSVYEYLDFFAAAYGLDLKARDKAIAELLALTDMEGRKNDGLKSLSRGMQQRVSLARSLVHDPSLLLLDEPASGLDPRARIELSEILRELQRMGKTIFISSHILSELAELCDSVTVIDAGEVKYSGAMKELLRGEGGGYRIAFKEPAPNALEELKKVPGVLEVSPEEGLAEYKVSVGDGFASANALLEAALRAGGEIAGFKEDQKRLNQVFLDLTQPGVRS